MFSTKDFLYIGINVLFVAVFVSHARECPMGYYGANCLQQCSRYCLSMECNNETGACEGDCYDGWTGPLCDTPCPDGHYGANCSRACSEHCVEGICFANNGTCIKGCAPGFTGNRCQRGCKSGFWGKDCKQTCSKNCLRELCNPESGYCLKGCKADFWGSDCSLVGNIKEAPQSTQAKFYDNLSAESRSVLLFILMNEYENTLERAQEEIRRGVRQRNDIRRIIG